jgi:hypothetical protein
MKARKNWTVLILIFSAATVAGAQNKEQDASRRENAQRNRITTLSGQLVRETQMRGYWFDISTGLVWAGKDNANDVNWQQAATYCRDLELAGYSNWRLPTIDELQGIAESNISASQPAFSEGERASVGVGAVRGGLSLAASDHWSSSQINGNAGYAWQFSFLSGNRREEPESYHAGKRALCVRRSDVALAAQPSAADPDLTHETEARGYWIDPFTGLMWAGRDNGKDVTWGQARNYCRALRLAGYADWRLATLDELESLVVKGVYDPHRVGDTEYAHIHIGGKGVVRDVRGGVYLAGDSWSSNRPLDRFHHPYSIGFFFNFITSQPSYDLQLLRNTKRVLCVRQP